MDDLTAAAASLGIETEYYDALGHRVILAADDLARIVEAFGPTPTTSTIHVEVQRGTELPIGSHWLPGEDRKTLRLIAPAAAYRPPFSEAGQRLWVLSVQLYGVRSERNWGHGDFTDLTALLEVGHAVGAAGIGLNPLHALFLDRPEDASPYSPNSRMFLNPLYIDVDAVPDFAPADRADLDNTLAPLRAATLVNYSGVAAVKRHALRAAHARFHHDHRHRGDFDAFRRERGDLLTCYAAFETLREKFGGSWRGWPEEWRRPSAARIADLRATSGDEMEFHEYVQWIADRQLRACVARGQELGLAVGLYLDMAVGVDPGGAAAWSDQDAVIGGLSIGAPPDLLNPAGQNWGLASFNPRALIASDFLLFRETLRALMMYAGAIRIDHVLGLNRFFLIPQGHDAHHGTYVRFPLQAMLAALAQESVAARCLVVGEDLGTVPDGLRETLADWGVWCYRLMMFERAHDGVYHPPGAYPRDALVSFNTHDLPSFKGWTTNHDFIVKRALGIDPGEADAERAAAHASLRAALAGEGVLSGDSPALLDVVRYLARTRSGLLAVSIDDVFEEVEQINVPGTVAEHPNWRRRWPADLEGLHQDSRLHALAEALATEGRSRR